VTQDSKDPEGVPAGIRLLNLVAVMDRLRNECPWDAKQTHESLAPYLLEETYEAVEALEGGQAAALREELGDVLLQVLFHARIASERTDGTGYTIDDVADGIASKLVRRHPHVFGDVTVTGAGEVKRNWDEIKAAERAAARAASGGGAGSALDGVPFGQPALSLAAQLQRRAARAGVPPELADLAQPASLAQARDPAGSGAGSGSSTDVASGPVRSGAGTGADVAAGPAGSDGGSGPGADVASDRVSETGAALFALVARACEAGLDPELELRAAARAYRERVQAWERAGDRAAQS
jgi:XTP/dITP diphosphohydrolase